MYIEGERITGVGALIVVPEDPDRGFLTLKELISKRSTHKVAGMRTLPMETLELGETHANAWDRLTKEEIQLGNVTYDSTVVGDNILCLCELRPGAVLHVSILEVPADAAIIIGSESQEVSDLRWTRFDDVLNAPRGDLGLRPGTREVVQSYLAYKMKPGDYSPRVYRYHNLQDKIPHRIFDLIEDGLSLEAALFRLNLASEPFARSVLLAHLQSPQEYSLNSAAMK